MAKDRPINWYTDADLVVPKQMPVRIFENTRGNIVIHQEGENEGAYDQDALVEIRKEYAAPLIAALTRLAGLGPKAT